MKNEKRFPDKADDYVSARPEWDDSDINELLSRLHFPTDNLDQMVIVDVGAGSGFLTEKFLDRGATVVAVEPNAPMRAKMEDQLGDNPALIISDGHAGDLKIPKDYEGNVDLIVSGNAHHWWGKNAPGNKNPGIDHEIASTWAKTCGSDTKIGIIFNKMRENAPEIQEIQNIGMKYFPEAMNSPFAPAKPEPFHPDQFSEYFEGAANTYGRNYDIAFANFDNFQQWWTSHSYADNESFKLPESKKELEDLYKSLPENDVGKKMWPYRVSIITGTLTEPDNKSHPPQP